MIRADGSTSMARIRSQAAVLSEAPHAVATLRELRILRNLQHDHLALQVQALPRRVDQPKIYG